MDRVGVVDPVHDKSVEQAAQRCPRRLDGAAIGQRLSDCLAERNEVVRQTFGQLGRVAVLLQLRDLGGKSVVLGDGRRQLAVKLLGKLLEVSS
ncbi:MAG: hypothetical protein ACJ76L_07660 [Conexibacter sp.]